MSDHADLSFVSGKLVLKSCSGQEPHLLLGQCKAVQFSGEEVRKVFTCRLFMMLRVESNIDTTGIL